jgi:hypothetical protein
MGTGSAFLSYYHRMAIFRYHNLIILLYTPAQGDLATEDNLPSLQAAAQRYMQLSLNPTSTGISP